MSIDMGHEFFKVALMRQGAPLEIVLNPHSKRKTPTAVSYFQAVRAFGDDALAQQAKAPSKVPLFFHSLMGTNFTSADAVRAGGAWWEAFALGDKFYSYNLSYDTVRGVPTFNFGTGNDTYPEEVLASIIYFAKRMSEDAADGKPVRDLVVTVPSDATLRQRQAVVAAGEIAGCRVLTLVHEGSAFAVQRAVDFQPEKDKTEIALFYNIGSRKTEVTIVRFESRQAGMVAGKTAPVVHVIGSAVSNEIGGHLMDLRIAEEMLSAFKKKHPKFEDGVEKDPRALRKLLSQAQKTKAVLSTNKNAPFIVESLYMDTDFQTSITRERFEAMCSGLFAKLTEPVERALRFANVTMADVSHLEVIGGGWRVPKIQEVLSEYFDSQKGSKLPLGQHLNGEEAGAMGAALVGANASTSFRVKKIFFADITMHEYKVQVAALTGDWEKNMTTLYPIGSALGVKKKLAFSMEEDFVVRLFEDDVLLSVYEVTGLENLLKGKWSEYNMTGTPKVTASVVLESSGIVEVKVPLVVVEETHWVNVTQVKPKANATSSSTTTENTSTENSTEKETTESSDDEAQATPETDDETKGDNDTNSTGNSSNASIEEYEVVLKLKKMKHEKKLALKRIDFKPMPMSAVQVADAKERMDARHKKEEESAAVAGLKNELEALIYSSRDKLEREMFVKVTTDDQREDLTKLCTEIEEWMHAEHSKNDYDAKLSALKNLLGPIDERELEYEHREHIDDTVKESVAEAKAAKAHIIKEMPWVNSTKVDAAVEKLAEFEAWWAKKQESQKSLLLSEAPAYTKKEVLDKLEKVNKEFMKLKSIKKPKEAKKPKDAKNATAAKKDSKASKKKAADEAPLPEDVAGTEAELDALRAKKVEAVEKEDFDGAQKLKQRETLLNEHLARLNAAKTEL